jgi:hypothetical protein
MYEQLIFEYELMLYLEEYVEAPTWPAGKLLGR